MILPLSVVEVGAAAWCARAAARARPAALFLVLFTALLAGGASGARGQSALDGFDPKANGGIRAIVLQPDGKILIGGDFTTLAPNGGATVSRNYIARLNPDGTLDTAFNPSADDYVLSIAVLADGKIVAGGHFTNIGGQPRQHLARLDATTGSADSFDPALDGAVLTIAVQSDGKILVGGSFNMAGGVKREHIARFDGTMGLLDSFDPQAGSDVFSFAIQADGKILVGGHFIFIGGQIRRGIARLDPTTGLADSFDPSAVAGGFPQDDVYAIAVQADGKILLGGSFIAVGGEGRDGIARVDPVTGHADSFNPNANGVVFGIVVQADGSILAAGDFTNIGGQPRNYFARLDPATGLADSFDPHPNSPGGAIAVQADGKILVGGYFTMLSPNGGATASRNNIARLETDGRLDQTLTLSFPINRDVHTTAVQPDGKILIGGEFLSIFGVERQNIARLNSDGTLDLAFNPSADRAVLAITVQTDGKILAGGTFTSIGGQLRNHIARLDPTTGEADSWDPNANGTVGLIAVQPDGKILTTGGFDHIGGPSRRGIARLDPVTGRTDSWDPHPNFGVSGLAIQRDGKIVVSGAFTNIGGQARSYIARLDGETAQADSWAPNASFYVYTIALQSDGRILVGGDFLSIGGRNRSHIARLDPTTGMADTFIPNANDVVNSIAVQADGKVLAGGNFFGTNSIGGANRGYIARLDRVTGQADSFDAHSDNIVFSIALEADGKILAGGYFDNIGGTDHHGFARLSNDTAALQDLEVTPTALTWTRGGSSQQFTRVSFEYSTDHSNYVFLGNGTWAGDKWILPGLSLPGGQNFYIRARGFYSCGAGNGSGSIAESVVNAFLAPAPQALNLSTRMRVQTGDEVGIAGFIITGTAPKHVLLRAIGPSLTQVGVPGAMADPMLELHGPGSFATITNDNWRDDPGQAMAIEATGIAPSNDLESAIYTTLSPGAYSAIISGRNGTSGQALIEVYDLSETALAKLANISTRAFISTSDDIGIAGFVLGNQGGNARIVLRGIGPSLTGFGVPNALANPTLELRDSNGALLAANNDWQDDTAQAAELTAAGLAPTNNLESGIAVTLPLGAYTALLKGTNNGTGIGLVEVYDRGAQ